MNDIKLSKKQAQLAAKVIKSGSTDPSIEMTNDDKYFISEKLNSLGLLKRVQENAKQSSVSTGYPTEFVQSSSPDKYFGPNIFTDKAYSMSTLSEDTIVKMLYESVFTRLLNWIKGIIPQYSWQIIIAVLGVLFTFFNPIVDDNKVNEQGVIAANNIMSQWRYGYISDLKADRIEQKGFALDEKNEHSTNTIVYYYSDASLFSLAISEIEKVFGKKTILLKADFTKQSYIWVQDGVEIRAILNSDDSWQIDIVTLVQFI
ncbi:MAG: hypothetical protein WDA06_08155 [Phenylobacterium sp.]